MRGPTVVGLVWSTLVAGGLVGVPTQPKLAELAVVDGQDNYRHRLAAAWVDTGLHCAQVHRTTVETQAKE